MTSYARATPRWTEDDHRLGCRALACPLGCQERPSAAVYARAAELAAQHAADYAADGRPLAAARAARAAAGLRAGAEMQMEKLA